MDGDNMGNILQKNSNDFNRYIKTVSEKISAFSMKVSEAIQKYHGQLIFAGGEDVNFIIHPEWLLECICELNQLYNNYFADDELTKKNIGEFTLSAGAVVCYHKYPLSSAILDAGRMLKDYAKKYEDTAGKYPKKNATAISLIKGHTEVLNLCFSNKLIGDLIELKESLLRSEISRTTPYSIKGEKVILDELKDNAHKENYLYTIIAGTRGTEKTDAEIKRLVGLLMKFDEAKKDTMADALLYARFLAGDK
jgi:CRISPR/Cas system-associated protein Cas10 (large subunit of type III CRISPR-Cas system)